jgi:hypothetical protein
MVYYIESRSSSQAKQSIDFCMILIILIMNMEREHGCNVDG